MKELGIYIHIPFCVKKCYYCDFISFSDKQDQIENYIECLKKEIEIKYQKIKNDKYNLTTIYFGGGTPSYIKAEYIEEILKLIKKVFKNYIHSENDLEITIEMNPGTVTKQKIQKYKDIGINRVSIGLQAVQNELLKEIGRIHSFEKFKETYELVKNVGISNINVDLMLGLPNQTLDDLNESIDKILNYKPNHISVYSLIVEDGTVMSEKVNGGEFELPTDDLERDMYWKVKNRLEKQGYKHYEISNFALKGFESKHNMNCWNQKEYLGIGLAAHSYLNGVRFSNIERLEEYMENINNNEEEKNVKINEKQDKDAMMREYMILNLRKLDGVDIFEFKKRFVDNPIYVFRDELKKLVEEELIDIDINNIRLTKKGLDLANVVWSEFLKIEDDEK